MTLGLNSVVSQELRIDSEAYWSHCGEGWWLGILPFPFVIRTKYNCEHTFLALKVR